MNEINYKEVLEDIAESQSLTVEKLVEETNKKEQLRKKPMIYFRIYLNLFRFSSNS